MALALLYLTGLGQLRIAWSLAAGAALALGILRGFQWMVQRYVRPDRPAPDGLMARAALVKLPALALILFLVVRSGWFNVPAFAGGVALIHAVIFLKAIGIFLMQREEDRRRDATRIEAGKTSL